jgi:hypothetical protein
VSAAVIVGANMIWSCKISAAAIQVRFVAQINKKNDEIRAAISLQRFKYDADIIREIREK